MTEHSPSPTPERAIYGFALYLFAWIGLVLYIVWAYIPDTWLHSLGLTYWPQKYWALAAPCYALLCLVFLIVFYVAYNFTITPRLDSINIITDEHCRPVHKEPLPKGSIAPIGDMDICEVNRLLYASPDKKTR